MSYRSHLEHISPNLIKGYLMNCIRFGRKINAKVYTRYIIWLFFYLWYHFQLSNYRKTLNRLKESLAESTVDTVFKYTLIWLSRAISCVCSAVTGAKTALLFLSLSLSCSSIDFTTGPSLKWIRHPPEKNQFDHATKISHCILFRNFRSSTTSCRAND